MFLRQAYDSSGKVSENLCLWLQWFFETFGLKLNNSFSRLSTELWLELSDSSFIALEHFLEKFQLKITFCPILVLTLLT